MKNIVILVTFISLLVFLSVARVKEERLKAELRISAAHIKSLQKQLAVATGEASDEEFSDPAIPPHEQALPPKDGELPEVRRDKSLESRIPAADEVSGVKKPAASAGASRAS